MFFTTLMSLSRTSIYTLCHMMNKQKQGGMKEEIKQIFVMSSTQRQQPWSQQAAIFTTRML